RDPHQRFPVFHFFMIIQQEVTEKEEYSIEADNESANELNVPAALVDWLDESIIYDSQHNVENRGVQDYFSEGLHQWYRVIYHCEENHRERPVKIIYDGVHLWRTVEIKSEFLNGHIGQVRQHYAQPSCAYIAVKNG